MVAKNKKLLNDDLENMGLLPNSRYANFGGLGSGLLESFGGGDDGDTGGTGGTSGGGGGKSIFEQYPPTYKSGEGEFRFDMNPTPETYDFNTFLTSKYKNEGSTSDDTFRFDWFPTSQAYDANVKAYDKYSDAIADDASKRFSILNPSTWFVGGLTDTSPKSTSTGVGLKAAGGSLSGTKKTTGTAAAGGMWQSALKAITDTINKSNSQTSTGGSAKTNSSGVQMPSEGKSGGEGLSTMAIIGIVVGGVAVLGTIIFLASRTTTTTPYTPAPMLPAPTK